MSLRTNVHPFPEVERYRERATRRRFATGAVMIAMCVGTALLVIAMIYVIALVVMLLANVLGAQASGRIEQRFKAGTQTVSSVLHTRRTDQSNFPPP